MPRFDPNDPRSYDPYYIEQEELTRFKNLPTIDTTVDVKPNFAVTQLPEGIAPSTDKKSGDMSNMFKSNTKTKQSNAQNVPKIPPEVEAYQQKLGAKIGQF